MSADTGVAVKDGPLPATDDVEESLLSATALAAPGTSTSRAPVVASEFGAESMHQLLHFAIERGTPVEQLEKLVDLADRMDRRAAAREFARAMAAFQAECPSIKKARTAEIATRSGTKFSYNFADLDDIVRIVRPILSKHGLSFTWNIKVDAKVLTCTCVVAHLNGHTISSDFAVPVENASAMSDQQKVGAAATFAKRQSLSAALGISTTNDDDDGAAVDPTPINEDQVIEIDDLIRETHSDRARFLKFMGVKAVNEIRAVDYQRALNALNQKKRGTK